MILSQYNTIIEMEVSTIVSEVWKLKRVEIWCFSPTSLVKIQNICEVIGHLRFEEKKLYFGPQKIKMRH